jgi:transcriptional regulator GlxA family with amidase domain
MKKNFLIAFLAGSVGIAGSANISAEKPATLTPPKTGKIRVAILLTRNATLIDFAGPGEVFGSVKIEGRGNSKSEDTPEDDQFPFELYTVGDTKEPVKFSIGMTVVPAFTFDDAPPPRVVVVGGQMGSPKMRVWLRKTAADPQTDVIMSVSTGAFRLATAGLLDGKPATTHHGHYDEFSTHFPNVKLRKGVRFVRSDAHIFTAGGFTSGIDLALHIVELYFGEDVAQRTANWMELQGTGWHAKD